MSSEYSYIVAIFSQQDCRRKANNPGAVFE